VKILKIISALYGEDLTLKELQLLTEAAMLPEKFKYSRFSSIAKDKIMVALKEHWDDHVASKNLLNSRIYKLTDKGFLRKDEDGVYYFVRSLETELDKLRKSCEEGTIYTTVIELDYGENYNT
jgi:hypothetical protein